MLILLTHVGRPGPEAEFQRVRKLFLQGSLEQAQQQAQADYRRFRLEDAGWAARFQILGAEAMLWRGLSDDALAVVPTSAARLLDEEEELERLTVQAVALTRLNRIDAAAEVLTRAAHMCEAAALSGCGGVMRAQGALALEQDHVEEAQRFFRLSQNFAEAHNDRWLAATALLNLSASSLHQEHFDEALDLARSSYREATLLGAADIAQRALGNQGRALLGLGDLARALQLFLQAAQTAAALGDLRIRVLWLISAGEVYESTGELIPAELTFRDALTIAMRINSKTEIADVAVDLAQVYLEAGKPDDADKYRAMASSIVAQSGNEVDALSCRMLDGQSAVLRQDWARAEELFQGVASNRKSSPSVRWTAQHALANLFESQKQLAQAAESYLAALNTFEMARASISREESRLPFLANATGIYDDYINLLIQMGKPKEALQAADWSRARTLDQDFGLTSNSPRAGSGRPPALNATLVAARTQSTLLFYWLGDRHSWLWAVSPEKTTLVPLPARKLIAGRIASYRRAVLALRDPALDNNDSEGDGSTLYQTLIAPVRAQLSPERPVIVIADGELSRLNFETLLAPATPTNNKQHYWIEDATVLSAPSIRMLAAWTPAKEAPGSLLLLGNAVSPGKEFPDLALAPTEIGMIQRHFAMERRTVFTGARATPAAYLNGEPEQYRYIHFVAHGTGSHISPLDSAVILSRTSAMEDSYKLYARDILLHPIHAQLVTISACNSSGETFYAGEGLVGLSWVFLRAGAHHVIGTLWEVSDESTPQLVDRLYAGIGNRESPAVALRAAKLSLLQGRQYRRPFYWAPFQLYAGR